MLTVGLDVDGVCADLLSAWLSRYNRDYGDSVMPEDVKDWCLLSAVKPECGDRIYDYLRDPTLYEEVHPVPGAQIGAAWLRQRFRVVYVTSCVKRSFDSKWNWLVQWGFLPPRHVQQDLVAANDKSLVKVDWLVDDYPKNLEGFGKRGILFTAPYNETATGPFYRAATWPKVLEVFCEHAN